MTSINAMRFNAHSGLMMSDEQRGWNDEMMRINSCDKVRPLVSEEIVAATGLVVGYGHTGTTSIGDEICETIRRRIAAEFDRTVRPLPKRPQRFMTVEDVAKLGFQVMTEIKTKCVDEGLRSKFQFTAQDLIKGSFTKDGKDIEIKDKEAIDTAVKMLTWGGRTEEVTSVFLNSAVIAGYHPDGGFRIFHLNMIDPMMEPVQELFLAEGSGLDIADLMWTQYANTRTIPERRQQVDRIEGTLAMLEGLVAASEVSAGVGGYFKLIYMDGLAAAPADRMKTIADRRSHLAAEITRAYQARILDKAAALRLIDNLLYQDQPFLQVHQQFIDAAGDAVRLERFLRGYASARL